MNRRSRRYQVLIIGCVKEYARTAFLTMTGVKQANETFIINELIEPW